MPLPNNNIQRWNFLPNPNALRSSTRQHPWSAPLHPLHRRHPASPLTNISTYADDTAIFSSHHDPDTATSNLQDHLQSTEQWTKKWRLKINETKSKHIIFTLRRGHCPPVYFNTAAIPRAESIKYLGLHFDKQLNWKKHVTTTRKHLDLKSRDINWLIGKPSPLSLSNKLLIYKTVLRPVWAYGIELWGCTAPSNATNPKCSGQ